MKEKESFTSSGAKLKNRIETKIDHENPMSSAGEDYYSIYLEEEELDAEINSEFLGVFRK